MVFCWYANKSGYNLNGTGYWFAAMNLTVHSFMYTYYAFAAMGHFRLMVRELHSSLFEALTLLLPRRNGTSTR